MGPNLATDLFVGDLISDVVAPRRTGLASIIASNCFPHGELKTMGASYVMDEFSALPPVLRNLEHAPCKIGL